MTTDITLRTALGAISTNQKLILGSFAVFITKKPKERTLLAYAGIQDTKIFLPSVMVITISNVKDVVVQFVFTQ